MQEQISSLDVCPQSISIEETTIPSENGVMDNNPEMVTASPPHVAKSCKATKAGEDASLDAIDTWKENGFSRLMWFIDYLSTTMKKPLSWNCFSYPLCSLLIAAPEQDVWHIVEEFLPLLSYSASFAIYHQYLQVKSFA